MQILVEQSLADAVGVEWTGTQGMGPQPADAPSQIALKNHALLVHRQEVDLAGAQLICSKTSLSGKARWPCIHGLERCRAKQKLRSVVNPSAHHMFEAFTACCCMQCSVAVLTIHTRLL